MNLNQQISEILGNNQLDEESSPLSRVETIETLIDSYGWEPIRKYFLNEILLFSSHGQHVCSGAIFWGVYIRIAAKRQIALLQVMNRLVWK